MSTLAPFLNDIATLRISVQFERMAAYITTLQHRICRALGELDRQNFSTELWDRPGGGGGLTRVTAGGHIIEKGGVNTAIVHGCLSACAAEHMSVSPQPFAACGISLVIHPRSPRVPSVHMNVRFFELADGDAWYGGGIDLTPYYPYPEDCRHFHEVLRNACESITSGSYPTFKEDCDRYFSLPHRGEMRGAGGIFFDYRRGNLPRDAALVEAVGDAFLPAYLPLIKRRSEEPCTDDDRAFQLFRRGRYVEFNLLYDRGTQFGLKTSGRVESILMSLPPSVSFPYDWAPPPGSPHAEMAAYYQPQDWTATPESGSSPL